MNRTILSTLSRAVIIIITVSFSSTVKSQDTSPGKAEAYVSCCTKDLDLAGRVKRMKVSSYTYENGIKASIPQNEVIYHFNAKGNCLSACYNDYSYSTPIHQIVEYSYDSSGNVLTEVYSENGEYCGKKKYQYNPFSKVLYNEANEVEEIISTEKNGIYSVSGFYGTVTEKHTDSEGEVVSKTVSYYKDGAIIKDEEYSSDNSISYITAYTYDSRGNLLLTMTSDASGQITGKKVNSYSEGVLVSTEQYLLFSTLDIAKAWRYDTKGREVYYCCYMILPDYLIQNISYEDDSLGNWKKQWIRDRNNRIIESIEREIEYY